MWPTDSLLGVWRKQKQIQKDMCTPCSLQHYFQQPRYEKKLSIQRWMNEQRNWVIYKYTHTGILFRHKKEWNLTLCENMKGLQGYYAKWNKLEKDKCQIIPLYVKFKQEEIKVMDTENRLVAVKRWEGWEKWLKRVKRYKLLLIK